LLEIRNTTFALNSTFEPYTGAHYGGAVYVGDGGSADIRNSVFWNNQASTSYGPDVYATALASAAMTYSCTQTSGWGTGTLVLASSPFVLGFWLAPGNAYADSGDNASVPADVFDFNNNGDVGEPVPIDLFGGARFVGTVDRGAYETPP